jgi:hypothetical protein
MSCTFMRLTCPLCVRRCNGLWTNNFKWSTLRERFPEPIADLVKGEAEPRRQLAAALGLSWPLD